MVSTPRELPWTVLYDADCGLCLWLLDVLLRWDCARRLHPAPLQGAVAEELLAGLSHDERMDSWHLVSPRGERWEAGAALPPLLRLLPGGDPVAAVLSRAPRLTERGYRWVAANRSWLSKLVPAVLKRRAAERVVSRGS